MNTSSTAQPNSITDYLKLTNSMTRRYLRRSLEVWHREERKPDPPYLQTVPLDRLLCGGENGLSAAQYARHTGNLLRPSTHVTVSPHVDFLRKYQLLGEYVFRPKVFRQTPYFKYAVECINAIGAYLTCTREEDIEQFARRFVALYRGSLPPDDPAAATHFRSPGAVVYVRPIQYSDCFEVRDGMHQLAIAQVSGEQNHKVYVMPPPVVTPVQQLILDHAFCRGSTRELYQPIGAPELGSDWNLIRKCRDRFELMRKFLVEQHLLPPTGQSYLDIACSYGWFVKEFGKLGFDAYGGGEIDWAACEIGRRVYGLEEGRVTRGEVVHFLKENAKRYDIVSCLSLLHHFILGLPYRASIGAEEMIQLVDRATDRVLFFDMGQEHEAWFREKLAGWNADYIEQWLRKNTTFTKIYRLGTDHDDVPPFEENYGRTLFACVR